MAQVSGVWVLLATSVAIVCNKQQRKVHSTCTSDEVFVGGCGGREDTLHLYMLAHICHTAVADAMVVHTWVAQQRSGAGMHASMFSVHMLVKKEHKAAAALQAAGCGPLTQALQLLLWV